MTANQLAALQLVIMFHIILYVVFTNAAFLLCGKLCVLYVYVSLEW